MIVYFLKNSFQFHLKWSLIALIWTESLGGSWAERTLGYLDYVRLETYEDPIDPTNNLNIFENLTVKFTCEDKTIGLYADPEYNCRVFHACDESGHGFPILCPAEMYFDQRRRVCTDFNNVDCARSVEWYYLNELTETIDVTDNYETESSELEYKGQERGGGKKDKLSMILSLEENNDE